jgi:hypothetical protein
VARWCSDQTRTALAGRLAMATPAATLRQPAATQLDRWSDQEQEDGCDPPVEPISCQRLAVAEAITGARRARFGLRFSPTR